MNFFGKKGGKGKPGQAQQQGQPVGEFKFDPSAPDAFSEENFAKMSGVDTMTFDENDPALMAELAEIGWEDEGHPSGAGGVASVPKGHRDPPPAAGRGRRKTGSREEDVSEAPSRQQGGNELLRSLGMSLNSMGDTELTEQDLQDPDLLKELEEVSGGVGDESNEKPLPRKSSKSRAKSSDADDQLTEQDLQDPDLLKELEEVSGGVDFGDDESREKPLPRRSSKTRAKRSDADDQLTEQDLQDPDLLKELEEVSGGLDFGDDESREKPLPRRSSKTRAKRSDVDRQVHEKPVGPDPGNYDIPQEAEAMMSEAALDEALGSMLEGDDAAGKKKPLRPAAAAGFPPRKPSRRASSRTSGGGGDNVAREIAQLEKKSNRLQQRALELKKAGDQEGAIATMRDRGALEQELQVLRTLATTQKVATVTTEYVDVPSPATPSPDASGDVGGGSSTPMSAERAMEEVTRLYQRAVKLKKENRTAEASDCKKRAKALEADLQRRGVVKARIASGEDAAVIGAEGRKPSSMRQVDAPNPTTPSSSTADAGAASAEKIMAKVTLLYQRAVELKKENRMAEAMNCMKRAKNLEADLVSKGLVAPGEDMSHLGMDGRRPSFSRQGSYASRSSRRSMRGGDMGTAPAPAPAPAPAAADGLRGRRSGSQKTELPDSVKAALRPKAFPAERDIFSDLEDALAAAVQIHKDRARAVVKKDRAAAAKEVKRYNELQGKLDLAREMRVVPGARPPAWQWKVVKKSRIRVLDHVGKDQMELEIMKIHGLTDKTDNKGSVWIKYDLGYSKDEKIGKGVTQGYRCEDDTVDVGFKALSFVKRARSMQMACQNRRAVFEIMHKSSIFSRERPIGKCLVPLQPLLAQCELAVSSPILTEGRREAGGSIELALRLRKPIASDELIVTEEKELEVGEWPPVSLEPLPVSTPTRTVAQAAAAASVPAAAASAAAPATAKASTRSSAMSAEFEDVKLTELEKRDPFAVENLDSNMLLESEIEKVQAKAATGDLTAVMRKGALETKLMMLVSAVQSGELDLPAYCKILRERIIRDKVLALHLKNENRKKEALAVLKRVRVMEEELAGVPEDQQGLEDDKEGVDGDNA